MSIIEKARQVSGKNYNSILSKARSSYGIEASDTYEKIRQKMLEDERKRQIQQASDYATQKQQEAKDLLKPTSIVKEAGKGILSGALNLAKETGKAIVRTGAMAGDIATRLSPIETIRNIKSGVDTTLSRPEGEGVLDAFKRGIYSDRARPLLYEKAQSKMEGKEFKLPELKSVSGLITQPEYRKSITSAAELPTYLYGGKTVETAGKGLLSRILSRTVATQPEAIIESGLSTIGEEKPTIKSAAMNYLTATLLMSGISNIAGEIKISKGSKEVVETKNELEKIYNNKLPEEASDDLAEAFSQGVKKETILENAKKTTDNLAEKVVKESPKIEPVSLKPGELAKATEEIEKQVGKLDIKQRLEVKNKLERGLTPEEIATDLSKPKEVVKPKIESKPEPKAEPKKVAKQTEKGLDAENLSKKASDSILNEPEKKLKKKDRLQGQKLSIKEAETGLTATGEDLPNRIVFGKNDKGDIIIKDGTHLLEAYREIGKAIPDRKVKFEDGLTIKDFEVPKPKKEVVEKVSKKSITAQKLNEVMPDDYKINEYYDKITLKGELDRASKEIVKDKEEALRKAFSREERVDRRIAKLEEFSQIAKRDGDFEAVNRLFTQANKIGTETAQGLNMLKALYAVNPEYKYMQEIINARMAKIRVGVKDIKNASKEVREMIAKKSKDLKEKTKQAFKVKDAQELLNQIMCK